MSELKVIEQKVRCRGLGARASAPRLYFWLDGETVLEHFFVGRRLTARHKLIRPLIPAVLEQLGVSTPSEIRYSRTAGCSCGCSPGFVLRGATYKGMDSGFDVFITVGAGGMPQDFDPAI